MKDSTIVMRAVKMMERSGMGLPETRIHLKALGRRLEDKERRDNGKECCEACGKWGELEDYRSDDGGCYYCPKCWKLAVADGNPQEGR